MVVMIKDNTRRLLNYVYDLVDDTPHILLQNKTLLIFEIYNERYWKQLEEILIEENIPYSYFKTKRWVNKNPLKDKMKDEY